MRRYEKRLARLEAGLRRLRHRREQERLMAARIRRWEEFFAALDREREAAERPPAAPAAPAAQPAPVLPPPTAAPSPPPPPLPPPPPPPPPPRPRPLVEFIPRGSGQSIAINTRTGQMASSADVLAALSDLPPGEE